MKGLAISASESPSTHDLFDRSAVRQAELGAPARERRLRHRIHDRLQRRIGGEAKLAGRLVLDRIPHLLGTRGNAGEEHRAPRAEGCRRNFGNALQSRHHASKRDARHARARLDRADVVAPRERLADDRARPAGHCGVGAAGTHHHRRQAQCAAIDVTPTRVVVDQHFADELLRAIGNTGRCRRVVGDGIRQLATVDGNRRGEDEFRAMARQPAGFEQIARRIEIHLGAKLEVLLRAAGDERREMEYRAGLRRDERARELRISDVAGDRVCERHAGLIGGENIGFAERAHQCGTDVARGSGDEYSHGRGHSNQEET